MEKSITKRALSMLLAVALILCTIPAISLPTFAASESDLTFELNDDGLSYKVSDYDDKNAVDELVIPSEYNGKPVTVIGREAFYYSYGFTSVMIPNSVTSIEERAFAGCKNLISIAIPNTVTYIGIRAFGDCTSLESIAIPNTVTYIGESAFSVCASLKEISVSSDNSKYSSQDGVLFNKDKTKLITYPCGKPETSYTVPSTVVTIGEDAFNSCHNITSVTVSSSVERIEWDAFSMCTNLTSVTISDSVTQIYDSFYYCAKLKEILVSSGNKDYSSQDGVLFNKDKTELVTYPRGKLETSYTVPSTVAKIGGGAFYKCTNLTSVTISDSVTQIDDSFYYCARLKEILVSSGNKDYSSQDGVLFNKDKTELIKYPYGKSDVSYTVPSTVSQIGSDAFSNGNGSGNTRLKRLTLPNSVKTIQQGAFSYCPSMLINVTDSIAEIARYAFSNSRAAVFCGPANSYVQKYANDNNIEYIVEGTQPIFEFEENWWSDGYRLKKCNKDACGDVVIPSTYNGKPVTAIAYKAFSDCYAITSVTIPEGITTIDSRAFNYCYSLLSVTIPETVTEIGYSAFEGCISLQSVTIPKNVKEIGSGVFSNCFSLEKITADADNENYSSTQGVLFSKDGTSLAAYPVANPQKAYTLPNGVEKILDGVFDGCQNLESITIPEGVTYIGGDAFKRCTALKSVVLPSSIEEIGSNAFLGTAYYDNKSNWTDGVLYIGEYLIEADEDEVSLDYKVKEGTKAIASNAFVGCEILKISIPDSVKNIGFGVFQNCNVLKSIILPNGITKIQSSTFYNCKSLKTAEIPRSVENIDREAFSGCDNVTIRGYNYSCAYNFAKDKGYKFDSIDKDTDVDFYLLDDGNAYGVSAISYFLKDVVIPREHNGLPVTVISWNALNDLTNLERLTIPSSIKEIQCSYDEIASTFYDCTNLSEITVESDNLAFASQDGVLFNKDKTVLYKYPEKKAGEEYTIPNSVTRIDSHAFKGCSNLKSVIIPDSVVEIGDYAFEGCSNLKSIVIPNSVTEIDYGTFYDCTSLESITIPDSVAEVGKSAFAGCTALKNITVPDNATYLSKYMFSDTAFYNDESNWEDGGLYLGKHLLAVSSYEIESFSIKKGTKTIAARVFEYCENLATVKIPDSLVRIGDDAFLVCSSLEQVDIPESVTYIGSGAFASSHLSSVDIPESVTYIGSEAFASSHLSSVVIPDGVTEIQYRTFGYCANLKSVTLPKSVTEIDDLAFKGCTSLKSVTLPDTLKSIGSYAFEKCTSLESVTIPGNVKTIGHEAFYECTGLKSVKLLEGIETIGSQAFWKCANLEEINIPKSVTSVGYEAFDNTAYIENEKNWTDGALYVDNCLLKANDTLPTVYEVKSGTRLIGDYAFTKNASFYVYGDSDEHLSITSVKIPGSVKSIGAGAFRSCDKLSSVEIEDGVKNIGSLAFLNCTSLKTAEIPESVTEIGERALGYTGWSWGDGEKQPGFTISGYKNSAAEKYANKNKFAFNALGTTVADEESGIKVSGNIDEAAALEVKLLSSDKSKITYDITLTKDGKAIQPDGTVTVKIPVPESLDGAKCRVYRVEENGKNTDMNAEFKDGFMVFKTTHFSKYILTTDDLSVVYGDINGDGKINTVDLAMLRKYLANRNPATGESSVSVGAGADVNGDGKINTVDLALLRKYLANKDPVTGESSVTLGPR